MPSDSDHPAADEQVVFYSHGHPEHSSNPDGKSCARCGGPAFIVTERIKTNPDRLNDVVAGKPLCRQHFREVAGYVE